MVTVSEHRYPSIPWLIGAILKAGIRRPWRFPHLIGALRGGLRLRAQGAHSAPGIFIALIEHMGDIIAAEPVSRYAARQHGSTPVTWVCRKPYREAVASFPAVDSIVTVGCMTEWLLLWNKRGGSRTWDLHISGRPCPLCRVGFRKPGTAGKITFDTYYNLGNLLKVNCLVADIPVLDEAPRLLPEVAASEVIDRLGLPKRFIVIHAKSNEDRRDWDTDKWHKLIDWLTGHMGLFVCEIGSSPVVITRDADDKRNLCGKLSLMQTAEVIARASLYIGIDSGPAHMANAAGTPGIILLGRYHVFKRYTPFSGGYGDGSRADLLRSSGLSRDISVEVVTAAVSRRLRSFEPIERGGVQQT